MIENLLSFSSKMVQAHDQDASFVAHLQGKRNKISQTLSFYPKKTSNLEGEHKRLKKRKNFTIYLQKFANLRVERSRGIPPRKPILLLALIELFEQGLVQTNQIFLSSELIAAFLKYWNHLGLSSHRADIALPFFYMLSDGFWHLKAKPGFESIISSKANLQTISTLKDTVQYAYLDSALFDLLRDRIYRIKFIRFIIESWFFENSHQVYELAKINTFRSFQEELIENGGVVYHPEDLNDEEKVLVREVAFRRIVSSFYQNRCACCGLQDINSRNQAIVDGTHIKPFQLFYDDRIDNGIALCKNHQWAFEQGWFTVDEHYHILIANDLWVQFPHIQSMREFHGKRIFLPNRKQHCPRIEALRWHRKNIFGQFVG